MFKDMSSRGKIVFFGLIIFVVLGILSFIVYFVFKEDMSDYGPEVSIVNYDEKVDNLPNERKQAISASIYNAILLNLDVSEGDIGDVFIREGTETQEYDDTTSMYSGSFIVDIPAIKQSYSVTYFYSDSAVVSPGIIGGYAILVECLSEDQLIYGVFDCMDMLSQESKGVDPIIQYLPYTSLSFTIRPDSTEGELVLRVTLRIPQVDLSGNDASKRQAVKLYKDEVFDWMRKNDVNPTDYTIIYNYSDDGTFIGQEEDPPV